MFATMGPGSSKPVKTKPHLVIRIKEGWRFEDKANQFVSEDGQRISTQTDLPSRSQVKYRIPQLANSRKGRLTKDEENLRRYFNVILPANRDPSEYMMIIKSWPCVEDVQLPPEIGLPNTP